MAKTVGKTRTPTKRTPPAPSRGGKSSPSTATTAASPPPAFDPPPLSRSLLVRFGIAVLLAVVAYFIGRADNPEAGNLNAEPFEVVALPGKGMGLVATRDIRQGERLIREEPLFVVPKSVDENPSALIMRLLQNVPPAGQAAFWNLSYVNLAQGDRDRARVALAIFETNAVAAGDGGVGIFPGMARLNHGCAGAFNAVYTWRERERALFVHALKDVKKGEELLTTYTDTKRTRSERRNFLSTQYGFECTCAVCSLAEDASKASDARLTAIAQYYRHFATWGDRAIEGAEAIGTINKIWELEEAEGYYSERGRLAADAAWIAAAHSDAGAVRLWALLAMKWYGIELGADSDLVGEVQAVAETPESHSAWGTRERMAVGAPLTSQG